MIDPRRQRKNDERATSLIELSRRVRRDHVEAALAAGDPFITAEMSKRLGELGAKQKPFPPGLTLGEGIPNSFVDPVSAGVALGLVEGSLEPLRQGVRAAPAPIRYSLNGSLYELRAPDDAAVPELLLAPLTSDVCYELVEAVLDLLLVVFDPVPGSPLRIERTRYARERMKLIEIEHDLWQRAGAHGGPTSVIPFLHRVVLFCMTWHPDAYDPPGVQTVCIRCGRLFRRSRATPTLFPRCPACAKETPAQRAWPEHAVFPHGRGTWLLRCQYPDCETVFEGHRHRKLCSDHTSSKLPPKRRASSLLDQ